MTLFAIGITIMVSRYPGSMFLYIHILVYTFVSQYIYTQPSNRHQVTNIMGDTLECPVCMENRNLSYLCSNNHGVCGVCYQRLNNKICPTCRGPFGSPVRVNTHRSNREQADEQIQAIKDSIANNTETLALRANSEGRGMQNANWNFDRVGDLIKEWNHHQRKTYNLECAMYQWLCDSRRALLIEPFSLTSTCVGNPHINPRVTRELKRLTTASAKLLKTVSRAKGLLRNRQTHNRTSEILGQLDSDMDHVRTTGMNVVDALDNPPRRRRSREDMNTSVEQTHRDVRQRIE